MYKTGCESPDRGRSEKLPAKFPCRQGTHLPAVCDLRQPQLQFINRFMTLELLAQDWNCYDLIHLPLFALFLPSGSQQRERD
jgi:hypothetical protein